MWKTIPKQKSSAITPCSMLTLINHHKMNFGSSWDLKGDTQLRSGHLCQVLASHHSWQRSLHSTHRLVSAVSPRISAARQNISSGWTLCCFPSQTSLLRLGPGPALGHTGQAWAALGCSLIIKLRGNLSQSNKIKCHRLRSVHIPAREIWMPSCGSQQVRALTERDQHILGEPGPAPGPHPGLLLAARGHVTRVLASYWLPAPGCCPTPGNRFLRWCAQG